MTDITRASRIKAALIDYGALSVGSVWALQWLYLGERDRDSRLVFSVIALTPLVLLVLTQGYLLAKKRNTAGKDKFRIRVVAAPDGRACSLLRLLTRGVVKFGLTLGTGSVELAFGRPPVLGSIVAITNIALALLGSRRSLHDRICATQVTSETA